MNYLFYPRGGCRAFTLFIFKCLEVSAETAETKFGAKEFGVTVSILDVAIETETKVGRLSEYTAAGVRPHLDCVQLGGGVCHGSHDSIASFGQNPELVECLENAKKRAQNGGGAPANISLAPGTS